MTAKPQDWAVPTLDEAQAVRSVIRLMEAHYDDPLCLAYAQAARDFIERVTGRPVHPPQAEWKKEIRNANP